MSQKVVAHFIDHTVVKGTSLDVDPSRPQCHIQTEDRGSVEVEIKDLKALYFVRDLGGRPDYDETHRPTSGDGRRRGRRQIELVFPDGGKLGGPIERVPPHRSLLCLLPKGPRSNDPPIPGNSDGA